jgi:hypothetical protein
MLHAILLGYLSLYKQYLQAVAKTHPFEVFNSPSLDTSLVPVRENIRKDERRR